MAQSHACILAGPQMCEVCEGKTVASLKRLLRECRYQLNRSDISVPQVRVDHLSRLLAECLSPIDFENDERAIKGCEHWDSEPDDKT